MTELRRLEDRLEDLERVLARERRDLAELIGPSILIGWGALLLMPSDTFALGGSYTRMARIASEEVWGMCALFAGLLGALGWWRNTRWARLVPTMIAGAAYATIVTTFAASGRLTTGVPVYGVLMGWQLVLSYRIAAEGTDG